MEILGSLAGTILIRNLGTLDNIDEMFFYNNKYYIIFSTTGTNEELWTSDGTNAGTTLLQSFLEPSYMHSFPSLNAIPELSPILSVKQCRISHFKKTKYQVVCN
ncbi:MAG: hypothetical protein IPN13_12545 [Bacteroidetes bacterium]|nr:hypothetical protein [Bacteroidota bacterium]